MCEDEYHLYPESVKVNDVSNLKTSVRFQEERAGFGETTVPPVAVNPSDLPNLDGEDYVNNIRKLDKLKKY